MGAYKNIVNCAINASWVYITHCTHWEYIYDLAGFSVVGMGYVNGLNTYCNCNEYTFVCEGLIIVGIVQLYSFSTMKWLRMKDKKKLSKSSIEHFMLLFIVKRKNGTKYL